MTIIYVLSTYNTLPVSFLVTVAYDLSGLQNLEV